MKSVQKIATLIKANQAIILAFFVHLQLWIFLGGYIEMCLRIYILDCISCNLFWSYWQFANKNSKQDATVCSSWTVGSDFGIHECTRKRATAEEVCFCSSYCEISSEHLFEGVHEIWRKSEPRVLPDCLYFCPTLVIVRRGGNQLELMIVVPYVTHSKEGSLRMRTWGRE